MITENTGTLAADADTIPLPTDYREPLFFGFTGTEKFEPVRKSIEFVHSQFSWDGAGVRSVSRPQFWATGATVIQFEHNSDKAYAFKLLYYGQLAALSPTNLTNFLTDRYSPLLYKVCSIFAYEWARNPEEKAYWLALANDELNDANVDRDLERSGEHLDMVQDGDMY